jgi:hypothetical protein
VVDRGVYCFHECCGMAQPISGSDLGVTLRLGVHLPKTGVQRSNVGVRGMAAYII